LFQDGESKLFAQARAGSCRHTDWLNANELIRTADTEWGTLGTSCEAESGMEVAFNFQDIDDTGRYWEISALQDGATGGGLHLPELKKSNASNL
jgi:hypothetical protein